MQIDRVIFPVHTLGPGERLTIWVQGCNKRCRFCANPELWEWDERKNISVCTFSRLLDSVDHKIDGFTISGGEPLLQPVELLQWIEVMKKYTDDILLFTGYSQKEIEGLGDDARQCLSEIAVYVAGEYVQELNDNQSGLLASSNQEMIILKEKYKAVYEEYVKKGRSIENFISNNTVISVGIHNRGMS